MANRTFAEIKQDIKNKTGNQQAQNAQLSVSANRGYERMITKIINLYEGQYYLNKASLEIVAGTQFYDLPADYLKHFIIMRPNGAEVEQLDMRTPEFIQREVNLVGVTNSTLKFSPVGYNAATSLQRIYVTPAPVSTETWQLWYNFMPAKMVNDGDTPLIPEIFDETLMLFAVADLYENQQNRSMASYFLNRGAGQLEELIDDIKTRNTRQNPSIARQQNRPGILWG